MDKSQETLVTSLIVQFLEINRKSIEYYENKDFGREGMMQVQKQNAENFEKVFLSLGIKFDAEESEIEKLQRLNNEDNSKKFGESISTKFIKESPQ